MQSVFLGYFGGILVVSILTLVFTQGQWNFIPLKLLLPKRFALMKEKQGKPKLETEIEIEIEIWSLSPHGRNRIMMRWWWCISGQNGNGSKSFQDFSIEINTHSKYIIFCESNWSKFQFNTRRIQRTLTLTLTPIDVFITLQKMLWAHTYSTNMLYNTDYTAGLLACSLSFQSD